MAVYQFRAADGEIVERVYPMSKAPDLGKKIKVRGKVFKRILSTGTGVQPVWKPYVSRRLPRHLKGIPCDASGKPIIGTQAIEREAAAVAGGGAGAWKRD